MLNAASENQFNEVVGDVAVMLGKLDPEHHSTSAGKTGVAGEGLTVMFTIVGVEWQVEVP